MSPRRDRPMIRVSCAAIPSTLIEDELFGHERAGVRTRAANGVKLAMIASAASIIASLPLKIASEASAAVR